MRGAAWGCLEYGGSRHRFRQNSAGSTGHCGVARAEWDRPAGLDRNELLPIDHRQHALAHRHSGLQSRVTSAAPH
jgi:hypothetical protein